MVALMIVVLMIVALMMLCPDDGLGIMACKSASFRGVYFFSARL
jgi:preprotein translocase subunit SecG